MQKMKLDRRRLNRIYALTEPVIFSRLERKFESIDEEGETYDPLCWWKPNRGSEAGATPTFKFRAMTLYVIMHADIEKIKDFDVEYCELRTYPQRVQKQLLRIIHGINGLQKVPVRFLDTETIPVEGLTGAGTNCQK
jgi:hypothetical protein